MRFTDLTSSQRSMLTHLAACGTGVTTDLLGRGCVPKLLPTGAASVLLDMRKKGLTFAYQKTAGQDYCTWRISEYGMSVFMSRPDDVPAPGTGKAEVDRQRADLNATIDSACAQSRRLRLWMIYPGGLQFQGTEEALAAQLAHCAEKAPGTKYLAYVLHSEAVLPVPKAQITLL